MLSYNHPKRTVNLIDEKNFKIIFESQTVFSVPKEKKICPKPTYNFEFSGIICLFVLFMKFQSGDKENQVLYTAHVLFIFSPGPQPMGRRHPHSG